MSKYYLPCDCGNEVLIETRQAGETVRCSCGRQLQVPAMRAIRQLRPTETGGSGGTTARSNWTTAHGVIFALGMIICLGGLTVAGYSAIRRWQFHVPPPSEADVATWVNELDSYSLEQQFAYWLDIRQRGLPSNASLFSRLRAESTAYGRGTGISLIVAAMGACLAVATWLFGRGRRPLATR